MPDPRPLAARPQELSSGERLLTSEGGGQSPAPEQVVAGQGPDARRRPTLCEARPRRSLSRERSGPVAQIAGATVNERALATEAMH